MATSQHRKGSADKMSNQQAAYHHDEEAKTKTNHSMSWPSRVATWPFQVIKQIISDYQSGRNMRKRITREPEPRAGDDQHWEPEDETNKQQDGHETSASATRGSSPRKYHDKPLQNNEQHRSVGSEVAKHWVHQAGEWPWRIEYGVLQTDPSRNFRVVSFLEVNDLIYYEMEAARKMKPEDLVPKTKRPVPHPEVEERDELMEYLTRP
ncbi:hypothetical protein FHL15_003113 [Xylaria flabelliformis]|uniref:Uncharacterized protein n=1 Tax=Xylaria flabelliformis TaxID=2512241 RepID=A0A553I6Y5_9PEZI|nr:hypothetical protein FHL15_003113 [Xylaria flabelliformis]